MEMPHSADRYSNMPLPFRRYREAATGCRDQFVVACLGSFVFVAVVVVVLAWHARGVAVGGRVGLIYLVSSFCVAVSCLLAPRHGVFRLSKSDIFRANAPMVSFLNEPFPLNNDAPIALYLC